MLKRCFILFVILLGSVGCKSLVIPNDFVYKEIKTDTFVIASWQKITDYNGKFKVYIEGDGASFDAYGRPTSNPTPKGKLLREIAFGDGNSNVIYLARPCQFVTGGICQQRHWTTARFAQEVVSAEFEAVSEVVGDNEIVLVGFSGGAQVAGLISVAKKGLNVKKLITIGGNLDHLAWTELHGVPNLSQSLNLADYRDEYLKIPQLHYVGVKDEVIPKELVYQFVRDKNKVVEVDASHSYGWEEIYPLIWAE